MLANNHRFHGRAGLRRVFQHGATARGRSMMLRHLRSAGRTSPRVAIVISKKVFKSAVKRNRVRRRVYEIVRHELASVPGGTDIVFTIFSPDVLTMPHAELQAEMKKLLRLLARTVS